LTGVDTPARCFCLAAATLLVAATTAGQTGGPANFDFTFSNPGARSMGFGGAFAPLADDATAAFANPAGLVQLLRPELSAELRIGFETNGDSSDGEIIEATGLGFASFVYPLRKWSFAVYGHRVGTVELARTQDQTTTAASLLAMDPTALGLELRRYGVAAGYQLDERFSLGLGVSAFEAKVESSGGEIDLSDGSDAGINAGLLWSVSDRVSLGGFYRQGPEFTLAYSTLGGALPTVYRPLAFPDSYGCGVAFRSPGGALTLAAEWARVQYSSLNSSLLEDDPTRAALLRDVNELHFGGEYAFLTRSPILALRFGTWIDPRRRAALTAIGLEGGSGSEDETHYATGLGYSWTHFQLDFGADYSESLLSLSISGIVSF